MIEPFSLCCYKDSSVIDVNGDKNVPYSIALPWYKKDGAHLEACWLVLVTIVFTISTHERK